MKRAARILGLAPCVCAAFVSQASATAYENYNPPSAGELSWTTPNLFNVPPGAQAWLEDSYTPWWQTHVAHPIRNYDASLLPTGNVRLDSALAFDFTMHRPKRSWTTANSPSGLNQLWDFTPGSRTQEDRTARGGQTAYLNLGVHPIQNFSADIGAEFVGAHDKRYWFPINDENRLYKDDEHAKIVRAEAKYDNKTFMLRGFHGVPIYGWVGQNDLFGLLPTLRDVEYYRRVSGKILPRGGELFYKSPWGSLNVIGGSEIRWDYGPSVFAKYDAPVIANLEQSLVYRTERIPYGFQDPEERRWTMSYNASYPFSDRLFGHAGLLYQPFRLDESFQDVDGVSSIESKSSKQSDAFGALLRTEMHPTAGPDTVGLGYTYLGPVAGNKHQIDADTAKTVLTNWTFSLAYTYRQPVYGPVPVIFEGTTANPGALLATPRGPDDPFWVQWDNRKAHMGSLTMVFDPTPGTRFYRYQHNTLDEWNISPDEDATWTAAVQYRVIDYRTNTDRMYYWDEDRNLHWDFLTSSAKASAHPLSSGTGLVRFHRDLWTILLDFSAGESFAGLPRTYTSATNFAKPSTLFLGTGLSITRGPVRVFGRYGKDQWGPVDYHPQLGWAYHRIYQAGLSYTFLRDFQTGFRYVGARMAEDFIGSDTGAFNEYRFFLTYHFTLNRDFSHTLARVGRPIPKSLPESSVTASASQFTPDGSTPDRTVLLYPKASSDAGILSYRLFVKNSVGETVRQWDGNGVPARSFRWDGLDPQGKPLPPGEYRATLQVVDLYGNETTSPPQPISLRVSVPAAPAVETPPAGKTYRVRSTAEGLKVTLSSQILFDVDKADLKESARQGLDQVIELLKTYPTNQLRISGFTDASGGQDYNQKLSEQRAYAVASYLERAGISSTRIRVVGYGSKRPVESNKTEEGRQQNRRVEIDILK